MIDLTPSQKGAVAEAAITTAALELGLTVLRPLCEGRRYDIVIDLEPQLLRVQCKLARELDGVLLGGCPVRRGSLWWRSECDGYTVTAIRVSSSVEV